MLQVEIKGKRGKTTVCIVLSDDSDDAVNESGIRMNKVCMPSENVISSARRWRDLCMIFGLCCLELFVDALLICLILLPGCAQKPEGKIGRLGHSECLRRRPIWKTHTRA